ncbi:PQQ-dependent sugar dehydrogenase [Methyloceanibacter stevinii]|uniref:PQQ-dependent sugar dehydrogenase n=1 Tax=Methyloceanibacter stevinii TaxID=1774970 RepID=UPI000A8EF51C
MKSGRLHGTLGRAALVLALLVAASSLVLAEDLARAEDRRCPESSDISLPDGFCATIFADKLGHVRQLAVTPDGVVYANTWSGAYYPDAPRPKGGFLVALKDTKGTGKADVIERFGPSSTAGVKGGTGIWLHKNWLYAESDDRIVRFELKGDNVRPSSKLETIVSGMPLTGDHPMHPFAIDDEGNLFLSSASATNTCEVKNRMPHSPGQEPCTELDTRGGVWRYDANKTGQVFSSKERYATGIRNAEGYDFDTAGRLYATQHGRDQLHENWPELYSQQQGFELPAEQVMILKIGANYGWPFCYYDPEQKKLVLAPEYGGDGGKKVGQCSEYELPVAVFPAHWAPNDLKIYKGSQFPKAYRGGAFIAFHGSWNRAPGPQAGYNVVFQPLADGKPSGDYVVFADGFAGPNKEPGGAARRPSGLAIGPDGALYIGDDKSGRIWRVTYTGDPNAVIQAAPEPMVEAAASSGGTVPPEGAQGAVADLPVPPGATREEVALGMRIFHGKDVAATCAGCHGANGIGTPVGPDLTNGTWLWGDGSIQAITKAIRHGVPQPNQHPGAMPPYGGVPLPDDKLAAVATYVWAIGHAKQ